MEKKNMWKPAAAAMVALSFMAGCGSTGGEGGQKATDTSASPATSTAASPAATSAASKAPTTINVMFRGKLPDSVTNIFRDEAKSRFNADLVIEYVDDTVYAEKLNVALAGGTTADIVNTSDALLAKKAVESNAFLPIDDLIASEPAFKDLPKQYLGKINGKVYTLPAVKGMPSAIYYRADWLKKLNLKVPATADELYQMMYAFTKNDPNGNGKEDTKGFIMFNNFGADGPFWNMFLPGFWTNKLYWYFEPDGTVKSSYLLADDYKAALSWFRKAYADGVLDKEYILEKGQTREDKTFTGVIGVNTQQPQNVFARVAKVQASNPQAELAVLPPIMGKYGSNYSAKTFEAAGYYIMSKTKSPDIAKKVYALIFGPEGQQIRAYGKVGVTYTVENGKMVFKDKELETKYNPATMYASVFNVKPAVPEPMIEKFIDQAKGELKVYDDPTPIFSQSPTYTAKLADIDKTVQEYSNRIIMGELPVNAWDEAITKLKSIGIDKMLEEINAVVKKGQ